MAELKFDLSKKGEKIKYMNAVNNGPTSAGVRKTYSNFDAYKDANISYARLHDASFAQIYGGEHTVDVHRIFKNFDADENDPASYVFGPTDKYLNNIIKAGTKPFYRLGASIEHGYKEGTYPPKDYEKWARICEHIIMHYNEGWADGFNMGIEYWEIWNEPDCVNADGTSPTWQGTIEEFAEFYSVSATYLKKRFPNLKIGGPALCWIWGDPGFSEAIMERVEKDNVPLDFFSFHSYTTLIKNVEETIYKAKELLDKHNIKAELILNEWNYIKGWTDKEFIYSLDMARGLKGSSFTVGVMCAGQATPLDMLMYYDARPCAFNGLFATETYRPLKTYYVFKMFSELLKLGTQIPAPYSVDDIYSCAATDGKNHAIMLTHYNDDDSAPAKEICVEFENNKASVKVCYYLLDKDNNLNLMREEIFTAEKFKAYIKMDLFSTYLIKIEEIN